MRRREGGFWEILYRIEVVWAILGIAGSITTSIFWCLSGESDPQDVFNQNNAKILQEMQEMKAELNKPAEVKTITRWRTKTVEIPVEKIKVVDRIVKVKDTEEADTLRNHLRNVQAELRRVRSERTDLEIDLRRAKTKLELAEERLAKVTEKPKNRAWSNEDKLAYYKSREGWDKPKSDPRTVARIQESMKRAKGKGPNYGYKARTYNGQIFGTSRN